MARKDQVGTEGDTVDLGRVRVSPGDAEMVHEQLLRLSDWLTGTDPPPPAGWRPPQMGSELAMSRFFAWGLRYATLLHLYEHAGWPARIEDDAQRAAVLAGRTVILGSCRVARAHAEEFRRACRAFDRRFGRPDRRIKGAKFLTIAVVGFAEFVRLAQGLQDLPDPPWFSEPRLMPTWSPPRRQ